MAVKRNIHDSPRGKQSNAVEISTRAKCCVNKIKAFTCQWINLECLHLRSSPIPTALGNDNV